MLGGKITIRRALLSIAIVALLFVVYSGAFLGLRQGTNITFLEMDARGDIYLRSPSVCYFSANPRRNVFLYRLFYPLHCRYSGDVKNLEHRLHHRFDEKSPPLHRRYYVEDVDILTRAGIKVRAGWL